MCEEYDEETTRAFLRALEASRRLVVLDAEPGRLPSAPVETERARRPGPSRGDPARTTSRRGELSDGRGRDRGARLRDPSLQNVI